MRITHEDVGRKCKFRCGTEGRVTNFKRGDAQPVIVIDADGLKSSHGFDGSFYSGPKESKWDIIAWSDEPATDQVADQYRPKDLRDEFAMLVSGHIWVRNVDMEINQACEMTANTAYMLADAMMKARGK